MTADYILGVDYGGERVGVAIAQQIARLPRPLVTLKNDSHLIDTLQKIVQNERVGKIVVGVPRNMDGTASEQSAVCEAFAAKLARKVTVPVQTADETLSSIEAESRLKGAYQKSDIDAMAAAIILERYFDAHFTGGDV
ncbi:Holliday junction resolvase RuvX [Candidatus Saccharibacteria bacterium]|nr:Holliday junction resolvase RuvX [Candidatus Saccharibacteria bacterium]